MKTVPGPLLTALQEEATTLALLVNIELPGGRQLGFTSSDRDIPYNSVAYTANNGCAISQIQTVLGTGAQAVTITCLISDDGVSAQMIEAGALDAAICRVYVVDFENFDASIGITDAILYYYGYIDNVAYSDRITAAIEVQPLLSRNAVIAPDLYSSNCRADLGDNRCTVDIDGLKKQATVVATGNAQVFYTDNADPDSTWQAGIAFFTGGDNKTFSYEIQDSAEDGTITLKGLMPFPIQVGDTLVLYPGCDKTTIMCNQRYANILNFQGEPFTVAPWITQADVDTSGGGATPDSGYYLYGITMGCLDSVLVGGVPNPTFGPVPDEWNFSGTGASTAFPPDTGTPHAINTPPNTVYVVATYITKGTFLSTNPKYPVVQLMDYDSQINLTADQVAAVKLKYPDAP